MTDEPPVQLDDLRAAGLSGTFEDALEALGKIVSFLETGRHGLDDSVATYDLGVEVAKRCQTMLGEAELRISQINVDAERSRRSLEYASPDDIADPDDSIDDDPF